MSAGWIYYNPDTGTEISDNHPVKSGEVPDAVDIRKATASELRRVLEETWRANITDRGGS